MPDFAFSIASFAAGAVAIGECADKGFTDLTRVQSVTIMGVTLQVMRLFYSK
jgi:hypothetical protein